MPSEILLYTTIGFCLLTLIHSVFVLRRIKKINRLACMVYDQLSMGKAAESPRVAPVEQNFSRFDTDEARSISLLDTSMALESLAFEKEVEGITKAEAHLMKVLQSKRPPKNK